MKVLRINQENWLKELLRSLKKSQKAHGISQETIALRIPNYRLVNILLKRTNKPLTGTSANISSQPASYKIKETIKQFENKKNQPDLVIDAGNLPKGKPSKIIDLTGPEPKILRK